MIIPRAINVRLLKDVSANTLQILLNQGLGVFIFLLLSRYLDKDTYGDLNWSLAVLTLVTTIGSLRLEQIVVRNVAAGKDPAGMLTLFTAHNLVIGTGIFLLLVTANFFFPAFAARHPFLWIVSISQLLTFFALPFRQLVTGKAAFGWLAVLATISNFIRFVWLGWLAVYSTLTIQRVLWIFTVSAGAEFILGGYIVFRRLQVPLQTHLRWKDYRLLILSSLPQVGMVFVQAGIARIDWVLLGILSTPARTAEYSFAYRAYEFSPLPLLILAPFLLNSFSRGATGAEPGGGVGAEARPGSLRGDAHRLNLLVRLETVAATLLPLWLVMVWSPLVDYLTGNKYGQSGALTFLILSAAVPFQYLINLYWTEEFAADRLGRIFRITAITGIVVLAGDCLLIPLYTGPGAAVAYLAAMIIQYILYYRASSLPGRGEWGKAMFIAMAITIISGWAAVWLTASIVWRLVIASGLYAVLMAATWQRSSLQVPAKLVGK